MEDGQLKSLKSLNTIRRKPNLTKRIRKINQLTPARRKHIKRTKPVTIKKVDTSGRRIQAA